MLSSVASFAAEVELRKPRRYWNKPAVARHFTMLSKMKVDNTLQKVRNDKKDTRNAVINLICVQ